MKEKKSFNFMKSDMLLYNCAPNELILSEKEGILNPHKSIDNILSEYLKDVVFIINGKGLVFSNNNDIPIETGEKLIFNHNIIYSIKNTSNIPLHFKICVISTKN